MLDLPASTAPLADRLREHVRQLAEVIGERHVWRAAALHEAADYIRKVWRQQGFAVGAQAYMACGVRCENLEVVLPGAVAPAEIVLVGAHYDTVRASPGANDNASGVAALLEIGRALAGRRLRRTVRLVAFVNEESPFFFWAGMGSRQYAEAARARGDDIRLMMALEMLGVYSDEPHSQRYPPLIGRCYPDRANFIAFVSNLGSRRALRRAVAAFRQVSTFPVEHLAAPSFVRGVALSDHLSFWRQGFKALMVTDTAFYRYRHYHTAQDTADKLDYGRMAQVVAGLGGAVAVLADDAR